MSEPKWVFLIDTLKVETLQELLIHDRTICEEWLRQDDMHRESILCYVITKFVSVYQTSGTKLWTILDIVLSWVTNINLIGYVHLSRTETPIQRAMRMGYEYYKVIEKLISILVRHGARFTNDGYYYEKWRLDFYQETVNHRNQLLTTCALVITSKLLSKDMSELLVKIILEK